MFEVQELFELGFHYGHRKWRSNPKMSEFVFCEKWGISIIDLCKTAPLFETALNAVYDCAKKGGKILFVGTKHQAKDVIAEVANSCNQYYVNKRWLGGTITNNFPTIHLPLNKLTKMEKDEESGYISKFNKKERLDFKKKKDKLLGLLEGVRNLGNLPNLLVVVDPKREGIAIKEAKLFNIPVVALADTDTPEPASIKYIVPGNDEGKAAIEFFLHKCADAVNQGINDGKQDKLEKQSKVQEEKDKPKWKLKEKDANEVNQTNETLENVENKDAK